MLASAWISIFTYMECVVCHNFAVVSEIYACGHYVCSGCGPYAYCPADGYPPVSASPSIAPYFAYLPSLLHSQTEYGECLSQILAAVQSMWTQPVCPNCGNALSDSTGICTVCSAFADLPSLRLDPSAMESCLCPKCNMQFSTVRCPNCGYMNLACAKTIRWDQPARAQESTGIVANPCWQCQNCRYEYNMQAQCLKCGSGQGAAPAWPSLPALQAVSAQSQYYPSPPANIPQYSHSLPATAARIQAVSTWRCSCGQENPAFQARCRCGIISSATLPPRSSAQAMNWTCRCGYGYNPAYQQKCTHCNAQKPSA